MPNRCPTFSARTPKPRQDDRKPASARGYDYAWAKFRRNTIHANPAHWLKCADCHRYAESSSDIHLDHIKPLDEEGKRWDVSNLQPLCGRCHGKKTRNEHKT